MSFKSQSFDAKSPCASVIEMERPVETREAVSNFGGIVVERSPMRIRPGSANHRPAARLPLPPDPDRYWRWLGHAGAWLLTLAIEGFAEYGRAMSPGFFHAEQDRDTPMTEPCNGPSDDRREDLVDQVSPAPKTDALARLKALAVPTVAQTPSSARRMRMATRLARLSTRWRRKAEAAHQAALLRTFSDHLLLDIGVTRDQLSGLPVHDRHPE